MPSRDAPIRAHGDGGAEASAPRSRFGGLSDRIRQRIRRTTYRLSESYWHLRRTRPGFDHLVRAYERYTDRRGDQLAGSVTYFTFLSFFPLIALAFAAVGYLAAFHLETRRYLEQVLEDLLPGLAGRLPIEEVSQAWAGAGTLGVLGLLYAGLGAVAALREALHVIWLKTVAERPNFVIAKLTDTVLMLVLGAALLASVGLTGVVQAATDWLLDLVGLEGLFSVVVTRLLGLVMAVAIGTLIFLALFRRLSGTGRPVRLLWRGALMAAVGFEILKTGGALLVRGTLDNPVYASFAVLVGLLVWINLVSRLLLFAAAWTATWLPMPPPYGGALPIGPEGGVGITEAAKPPRPGAACRSEAGPSGRRSSYRVLAGGTALFAALGYGLWARWRRARRKTDTAAP